MECPVSDFDSIKKVLEREYKKPIEEVFVSIDPVPLGSASLAQVHKGVLKDGSVVAIKVIIDDNLTMLIFRSSTDIFPITALVTFSSSA